MEVILQQLATAIGNMNWSPTVREVHVIDYPIFRGGEQDPNQWWKEFQQACTANKVSNKRRLNIVSAYLKSIAHSWWNQIEIQYWHSNYNANYFFSHLFQNKWCTDYQKSRWMNQLRSHVQLSGETVDEYLDDIDNLYHKANLYGLYPLEDKMR